MGGPIIRVGATPEFAKGWDAIFGAKDKPAEQPAAPAAEQCSTTQAAPASLPMAGGCCHGKSHGCSDQKS